MLKQLTSSIVVLVALLFLLSPSAHAQTDHGGGNLTWANEEVSGVHVNINTLTINGLVTVASKVSLVVTAATINVNGGLLADGAGYAPGDTSLGQGEIGGGNAGAGGGGYGGVGGDGTHPTLGAGGTDWGIPNIATEILSPNEFGSGGGAALASPGGSGGGAIKLVATGTMTINGEVSADGQKGDPGNNGDDGGGAGAGGSVWLICNTLAGSGMVTAYGGAGDDGSGDGGGGGGGRIAVSNNTDSSVITYDATGGFGPGAATDGGDGTLRINGAVGPSPTNYYDFGGADWHVVSDRIVAGIYTNIGHMIVSNCTATVEPGEYFKAYASNITIASSGTIDANSGGVVSAIGTSLAAGGGGYGGGGGDSSAGVAAGWAWGDPSVDEEMQHPDELGSNAAGGGAGGGAIRLVASDVFTLDGTITANGGNGPGSGSGGGSGGSIWLDCDTLSGGGTVTANGGNSHGLSSGTPGFGGGGGGGRVAIYCTSDSSTITLDSSVVAPGTGASTGEDGQNGTLWKNSALVFTNTWVYWNHSGADWTLSANTFIGGTHVNVGLFQVDSNVTATVIRGTRLDVAASDIIIHGTLTADGRGYATGRAPAGNGELGANNQGAGGGGYGGAGGTSSFPHLGGLAWGDPDVATEATAPNEWGSAGGYAYAPYKGLGGSGGGVIKLVSRDMLVDGLITANGMDGFDIGDDGQAGGAGGSVWLETRNLTGTGTVSAAGGDAQSQKGAGGGGGGRIAIYWGGNDGFNLTTNVAAGITHTGGTLAEVGTCVVEFRVASGTFIILY